MNLRWLSLVSGDVEARRWNLNSIASGGDANIFGLACQKGSSRIRELIDETYPQAPYISFA